MSTIRRQISISTNPRSVWNALTTPEGLGRWLGEARVDPRAGGRITVRMAGDEEGGFLHVFRPTAKLEVNWDRGPWKGTFTQFSVARDGDETVVNVQHAGTAFEDDAVRAPADELWRKALTSLRDGLETGR
ncbi:MAG: SRPBCC family protein [Myxococcota bacterium]